MKMKFNLVSHSFLSESETFVETKSFVGGEEIYLYDLAKLLIKLGNDVTILLAGKKEKDFFYEEMKIRTFKVINKRFFNLAWKKKIEKNSDHVHLHDFEYAYPLATNNMTGTCHGVTWDIPTNGSIYWKSHNFFHKFLARQAIKLLNKIASVDSFLLRFVQSEMPNYRDKIEIIYSYVNTNTFNPKVKGKEIKKKYENRKIILFPRNLTFVRGSLLILEAMKYIVKKYPEVLLIMTGTGPLKNRIEFLIKENKLENNVALIGHQDHFKDMPKLYAASDLVVIPSLGREGCSLSCLEAMATRRPVVVTNVGGLLDIVIDNFNGLISKVNPMCLAKKITYLLENKGEAKRVATNGYWYVKKYFNYDIWCKKYAEFFGIA